MNASLNFGQEEKPKLRKFLQQFPELGKGSRHEELRARVGEDIVTLYSTGKVLVQGPSAEKTKAKVLSGSGVLDELILGIDETGRGENSGPLVVAAVLGWKNKLRGLRDSKKTGNLEKAEKEVLGNCEAKAVVSRGAAEIDRLRGQGETMNSIESAIINELIKGFNEKGFKGRVVVDGSKLKGVEGKVDFLPKADDLNPVVGAASVLAKSAREKSKDKGIRKSWKSKH